MKMMKKMRIFKKMPLPVPRECPFCGGVPRLSRCGDQKEFWVVQCSECYETPVDYDEAKVTQYHAIKLYNKRADFASRIIRIHHSVEAHMTKFTSSEVK